MQELWRLKVDWDASVPQYIATAWLDYRNNLNQLNSLNVPRHLFGANIPVNVQLHCFSDASERAYGATIYTRCETQDGTIFTNLLCAKSRVAPLKKLSLPRLKLAAACLLVELVEQIRPILNFKIDETLYYSDSTIVLHWINSSPSDWKTYVANRVSRIQQVSSVQTWNHITSHLNPADIVSRGMSPDKLVNNTLWFNGPQFLATPRSNWPKSSFNLPERDMPEKRKQVSVLTSADSDTILETIKFKNNFTSFRNVVCYMLRFKSNAKISNPLKYQRQSGPLTVEELNNGTLKIMSLAQLECFGTEIKALKSRIPLPSKSRLISLSVFLDDNELIRVGGRIQQSNLPYNTKHPIVLASSHFLTYNLLIHYHKKMLHAGPQALLAAIRSEYWPLDGRRLCRKVFHNCITCFKVRPTHLKQIMGNLPAERTQIAPPFSNVGIDFCGPFYTHYRLRGKRPTKSYVCVFVCFAVRAIHLEVSTELTTDAFMGCLKRFVATRGMPTNIFSDNGSNFVGANSQLHEMYQLFQSEEHQTILTQFTQENRINWHFSPPGSPHFGGLYEAAVKSAKFHLRRIMGNAKLTFEELTTLMKQIEAVLNSRPLTPLTENPDDLQALTPGHFLIGRPLMSFPEPTMTTVSNSVKRWQLQNQLYHHFWSRWSNEYITQLQQRNVWRQITPNVTIGQLVIIKENGLPPLNWKLGRILEVYPGADKLTRVVMVKTQFGVLKRGISNICPLPVESSSFQEAAEC